MTETTVSSILQNITSVIDEALTWMQNFAGEIVTNPVLFIFVVAVPLVGLGVGLLNRLIRAN